MADRYLSLVNSPFGARVASTVGLPRPAMLRRYSDDQPLLHGPALLGSTAGADDSELGALADLLTGAGVELRTSAPEPADALPADGAEPTRWGALIVDARPVTAPGQLSSLARFLTPQLRSLLPGGRVLVLARAADSGDITVDAARQAIEGIVRSLAKELLRGSTANLLLVEDDASLESALRFFLSGKSAYVDGQPVRLGPGSAPSPADWRHPLAGKTALVTGAARGIGRAIAGVLARDGAHVIAADLLESGEALAQVANALGGTSLHLDVAAPDAPQRLLDHLAAYTDGLDILIHNAGITRDKLLANMKPAQWDAVLAVNLESQLRINAALLESSSLNRQARVVALASTTGLAGNRGQTNYAASKAGILGMVRTAAATFAAHGNSTINAVAPGFIDTEMTARMPFATREVARRLSSLQQAGLPIDVAETVAWLASPAAGGINGQVVRVCGQNLVGA
jgi:3-oxoacyl-[acyl-carrier protein] reductase